MATPTLDQTRTAASGIHSMPDDEFKARRSREAGDALTAFFVILARKLFPTGMEDFLAPRVDLMLAAYFLRGEVDHAAVKAPDENRAKAVIQKLSALDGQALDRRIGDEVGDAVMAFFAAFAKKVLGDQPVGDRDRTVQLMVLAYLARKELASS